MKPLAAHSHRSIPLALSPIQAGPAAEVGEDFRLLDVNALITGNREGFVAFEVTGDSGVPYIHPGNLIFVDTWRQPEHGQVVAVEVDGLVAVKKFERSRRGLYLVSANVKYPPREITAKNAFRVLGVVRGHLAVY